ncbi:MAG TPA: Asp-tRNA(Asn)/Glu-tRNA(Gln) amidotransferase subunit GatB [Clostridia bacterium]|nr:Asp-tRNA(Asn)/Glu-tRNA(Gln) amidotransferase subunit GatB [Clostridia bacterium]
MNYEAVIGLEIHVELNTKSKMFCGCSTKFGGQPNSQCCPLCTGMPGTLPSMNKEAVRLAVMAGLALNCNVSQYNRMDRKSYFYPDLPKGYQITQQYFPICRGGHLDIQLDGQRKRIGITRIHLEEDAGKLVHDELKSNSLVDYNRAGIPLIEIVTEPHIESPEEAVEFLEELRLILVYLGVSECKMAEGGLRCDVNLSIKPKDQDKLETRTEMKNLNSFRAIYRAIKYETSRQLEVIGSGEQILQQTRKWDDSKGIGITMRDKEQAHNYRYFNESHLPPFEIDNYFIDKLKVNLIELPAQKRERFVREYKIPEYDARVLTTSNLLASFFEDCLKEYDNKDLSIKAKTTSNWIMGDVMRLMKEHGVEIQDLKLKPAGLVELMELVDDKTISGTMAKDVLEDMCIKGKSAQAIVADKGLEQISGMDELGEIVRAVMEENPKSIQDIIAGKKKALGYLVGQTMKKTKGKANPQLVNKILKDELRGI